MAALAAKLREPGRMAEFMKTGKSTPADAGAQLPNVRCPALVIMGTLDPDFADPRAEGDAIVAAMPAGARHGGHDRRRRALSSRSVTRTRWLR